MQYKLFKLKFRTPLHIGDIRPNYESCEGFIHSDTLFSALMNAWRLLYPEDLELFFPEAAPDSFIFPYFRISSAFPYVGEELFFPKPQVKPIKTSEEAEPGAAKQFKKLTWIAQPYFEQRLSGQNFIINADLLSEDGRLLFSAPKSKTKRHFFDIQDSPRVVKDRANESTEIFYFSRLYFADNAGLYFLAQFQNEEWATKFKAVLNLLGDEGIGGDRSVGNGLFEVAKNSDQEQSIELKIPAQTSHFLTLALYHPRPEECPRIIPDSSYDLTLRGGWVFSNRGRSLRRRTVRMFTEGSVFSGTAGDYGVVVRVLEPLPEQNLNHAVYRYGQAFSVPIIVGEEQ